MGRVIPHYVTTPEDFHSVVGLPERRGTRESKVLEFKKSLNRDDKQDKEIVRDITQFANSDGGVLLLGVAEGGQGRLQEAEEVVGVADPNADIRRIRDKLRKYCNDRTFVSEVEMHPLEVRSGEGLVTVIAVNVRPRPRLIYLWSCDREIECFIRTDEGKLAMRVEDIEARLMDTTRLKRLRVEELAKSHKQDTWTLHGKQHERQPHEKLKDLSWHPEATNEYEVTFTGNYMRLEKQGQRHATLQAFHLPYAFIVEIWTDTYRRVHLLHEGWLDVDEGTGACMWLPARPYRVRQVEAFVEHMNKTSEKIRDDQMEKMRKRRKA